MQIEVVVNCGAGSADADEVEAERERVAAAFAPLGFEPRVGVVTGSALASAVEAALERGADVVAVGGGDGTLGTAARVVADADAVLGVLPMGTFNHFAKDLSLPVDDLEAAARVVVEGETASIDLGEVNGTVFVNNSTIGVYPVMVDLRDHIRSSRGWGKLRAVPVAAWRALRRFPTRRMDIRSDEGSRQLRTPFVFVGNNSYAVGPTGVGARTDLDGGVLCCYVADVTSRLGLVRMALQTVVRGADAAPMLDSFSTGDLVIGVHGHRVLVALDGEISTLRAPLAYRCRPGDLRVRIPVGSRPLGDPPTGPEAGAGIETDADRS